MAGATSETDTSYLSSTSLMDSTRKEEETSATVKSEEAKKETEEEKNVEGIDSEKLKETFYDNELVCDESRLFVANCINGAEKMISEILGDAKSFSEFMKENDVEVKERTAKKLIEAFQKQAEPQIEKIAADFLVDYNLNSKFKVKEELKEINEPAWRDHGHTVDEILDPLINDLQLRKIEELKKLVEEKRKRVEGLKTEYTAMINRGEEFEGTIRKKIQDITEKYDNIASYVQDANHKIEKLDEACTTSGFYKLPDPDRQ